MSGLGLSMRSRSRGVSSSQASHGASSSWGSRESFGSPEPVIPREVSFSFCFVSALLSALSTEPDFDLSLNRRPGTMAVVCLTTTTSIARMTLW